MNGGRRLSAIFAQPFFAVWPTLSTLLVGLIGSWFLWELRATGTPTARSLVALLVAIIITGALVALRELGRDHQQREATQRLETAIGDVRAIAQTMPPRTFLSDFDRLYQRDSAGAEQLLRACHEWLVSAQRTHQQREAVRRTLDEMIRRSFSPSRCRSPEYSRSG